MTSTIGWTKMYSTLAKILSKEMIGAHAYCIAHKKVQEFVPRGIMTVTTTIKSGVYLCRISPIKHHHANVKSADTRVHLGEGLHRSKPRQGAEVAGLILGRGLAYSA
jgi:hypothetical protein